MDYPYEDIPDVPPLSLLVPSQARHPDADARVGANWHRKALGALLDGIRTLRADHTSGARDLATKAVDILALVADVSGNGLIEEKQQTVTRGEQMRYSIAIMWWNAIKKAGWALSQYGRPSMAAAITFAVVNAIDFDRLGLPRIQQLGGTAGCLSTLKESPTFEDMELIKVGIQRIRDYVFQRTHGGQRSLGVQLRQFLRRKFAPDITSRAEGRVVRILTLSSSATIRNSLATMLEMERGGEQGEAMLMIDLRIMESRPLCEGVEMARNLVGMAKSKGYEDLLNIQIGSDASVASLAKNVDVVLLGADRISEAGDICNKIGSLPAVLCAKAVSNQVTIVVVSELEKVAKPGDIDEKEEVNDEAELVGIWDQVRAGVKPELWDAMVKIKNIYFEWVPAKYIDCYICEIGTVNVEKIQEQSHWVAVAESRLLGDLE